MERNIMILNLLGLVRKCPAAQRSAGCVCRGAIRHFGLHQAYMFLQAMDDDFLSSLLQQHRACLGQGECRFEGNINQKHLMNN
jgi:hypothetical protein